MRSTKLRKIISLIVAILFLVNDICFGLGVMPASVQPEKQEEILKMAGGKLWAKNGPGSIDFDRYDGQPRTFIDGDSAGSMDIKTAGNYRTKFVKCDYSKLPEGWENNPILQQTDLIDALKMFRKRAEISEFDLDIRVGYFPLEKEKDGELPIAQIETLGKGRHVLVVHTKFAQMWNDIREHDVWFEADIPGSGRRTISVAWGIFYHLARHEMAELSKRDFIFKSLGHFNAHQNDLQRDEVLANLIGGNYSLFNDAAWMWFLGSYAIEGKTRYNNNEFLNRVNWFLDSKDGRNEKFNLEFPDLLKDIRKRRYAMALASAINYNYFSRDGIKVPDTNFIGPRFIDEYNDREAARKAAGITEEPLYAAGAGETPAQAPAPINIGKADGRRSASGDYSQESGVRSQELDKNYDSQLQTPSSQLTNRRSASGVSTTIADNGDTINAQTGLERILSISESMWWSANKSLDNVKCSQKIRIEDEAELKSLAQAIASGNNIALISAQEVSGYEMLKPDENFDKQIEAFGNLCSVRNLRSWQFIHCLTLEGRLNLVFDRVTAKRIMAYLKPQAVNAKTWPMNMERLGKVDVTAYRWAFAKGVESGFDSLAAVVDNAAKRLVESQVFWPFSAESPATKDDLTNELMEDYGGDRRAVELILSKVVITKGKQGLTVALKSPTRRRSASGGLTQRPGKNPNDALKVIGLSDLFQKNAFTLKEYLEAYETVRNADATLKFEKLAANPESTARRNLNALVDQGILATRKSGKEREYVLTNKGEQMFSANKVRDVGLNPVSIAVDNFIADIEDQSPNFNLSKALELAGTLKNIAGKDDIPLIIKPYLLVMRKGWMHIMPTLVEIFYNAGKDAVLPLIDAIKEAEETGQRLDAKYLSEILIGIAGEDDIPAITRARDAAEQVGQKNVAENFSYILQSIARDLREGRTGGSARDSRRSASGTNIPGLAIESLAREMEKEGGVIDVGDRNKIALNLLTVYADYCGIPYEDVKVPEALQEYAEKNFTTNSRLWPAYLPFIYGYGIAALSPVIMLTPSDLSIKIIAGLGGTIFILTIGRSDFNDRRARETKRFNDAVEAALELTDEFRSDVIDYLQAGEEHKTPASRGEQYIFTISGKLPKDKYESTYTIKKYPYAFLISIKGGASYTFYMDTGKIVRREERPSRPDKVAAARLGDKDYSKLKKEMVDFLSHAYDIAVEKNISHLERDSIKLMISDVENAEERLSSNTASESAASTAGEARRSASGMERESLDTDALQKTTQVTAEISVNRIHDLLSRATVETDSSYVASAVKQAKNIPSGSERDEALKEIICSLTERLRHLFIYSLREAGIAVDLSHYPPFTQMGALNALRRDEMRVAFDSLKTTLPAQQELAKGKDVSINIPNEGEITLTRKWEDRHDGSGVASLSIFYNNADSGLILIRGSLSETHTRSSAENYLNFGNGAIIGSGWSIETDTVQLALDKNFQLYIVVPNSTEIKEPNPSVVKLEDVWNVSFNPFTLTHADGLNPDDIMTVSPKIYLTEVARRKAGLGRSISGEEVSNGSIATVKPIKSGEDRRSASGKSDVPASGIKITLDDRDFTMTPASLVIGTSHNSLLFSFNRENGTIYTYDLGNLDPFASPLSYKNVIGKITAVFERAKAAARIPPETNTITAMADLFVKESAVFVSRTDALAPSETQRQKLLNDGFNEVAPGYFLQGNFLVQLGQDADGREIISNVHYNMLHDFDGKATSVDVISNFVFKQPEKPVLRIIYANNRYYIEEPASLSHEGGGRLPCRYASTPDLSVTPAAELLKISGFKETHPGFFTRDINGVDIFVVYNEAEGFQFVGRRSTLTFYPKEAVVVGVRRKLLKKSKSLEEVLTLKKRSLEFIINKFGHTTIRCPREMKLELTPQQLYTEVTSEGFKIGGQNNNDIINGLTHLAGLSIEELEPRMRKSGFLHKDEKLKDALTANNTFVLERGLTHQQLAEPLFYAMNLAAYLGVGDHIDIEFPYQEGRYRVTILHTGEKSIIPNDGLKPAPYFDIRNLKTDKAIQFRGFVPYYIARYGLYKDWIDLHDLLDMFPNIAAGASTAEPSEAALEAPAATEENTFAYGGYNVKFSILDPNKESSLNNPTAIEELLRSHITSRLEQAVSLEKSYSSLIDILTDASIKWGETFGSYGSELFRLLFRVSENGASFYITGRIARTSNEYIIAQGTIEPGKDAAEAPAAPSRDARKSAAGTAEEGSTRGELLAIARQRIHSVITMLSSAKAKGASDAIYSLQGVLEHLDNDDYQEALSALDGANSKVRNTISFGSELIKEAIGYIRKVQSAPRKSTSGFEARSEYARGAITRAGAMAGYAATTGMEKTIPTKDIAVWKEACGRLARLKDETASKNHSELPRSSRELETVIGKSEYNGGNLSNGRTPDEIAIDLLNLASRRFIHLNEALVDQVGLDISVIRNMLSVNDIYTRVWADKDFYCLRGFRDDSMKALESDLFEVLCALDTCKKTRGIMPVVTSGIENGERYFRLRCPHPNIDGKPLVIGAVKSSKSRIGHIGTPDEYGYWVTTDIDKERNGRRCDSIKQVITRLIRAVEEFDKNHSSESFIAAVADLRRAQFGTASRRSASGTKGNLFLDSTIGKLSNSEKDPQALHEAIKFITVYRDSGNISEKEFRGIVITDDMVRNILQGFFHEHAYQREYAALALEELMKLKLISKESVEKAGGVTPDMMKSIFSGFLSREDHFDHEHAAQTVEILNRIGLLSETSVSEAGGISKEMISSMLWWFGGEFASDFLPVAVAIKTLASMGIVTKKSVAEAGGVTEDMLKNILHKLTFSAYSIVEAAETLDILLRLEYVSKDDVENAGGVTAETVRHILDTIAKSKEQKAAVDISSQYFNSVEGLGILMRLGLVTNETVKKEGGISDDVLRNILNMNLAFRIGARTSYAETLNTLVETALKTKQDIEKAGGVNSRKLESTISALGYGRMEEILDAATALETLYEAGFITKKAVRDAGGIDRDDVAKLRDRAKEGKSDERELATQVLSILEKLNFPQRSAASKSRRSAPRRGQQASDGLARDSASGRSESVIDTNESLAAYKNSKLRRLKELSLGQIAHDETRYSNEMIIEMANPGTKKNGNGDWGEYVYFIVEVHAGVYPGKDQSTRIRYGASCKDEAKMYFDESFDVYMTAAELDEHFAEFLAIVNQRVHGWSEKASAKKIGSAGFSSEVEEHPLIRIISEYTVPLAADKGPGVVKMAADERTGLFNIVNMLHDNTQVEIILASSIGISQTMRRAIKDANIRHRSDVRRRGKGEERDIITCRLYSDEDNLKKLLESSPEAGVKRIVITDKTASDTAGIEKLLKLAADNASLFKETRLFNVMLPEDYAGQKADDKTFHQARIIMIAIMARLIEKDSDMAKIALGAMLDGYIEGDVGEFVENLARGDDSWSAADKIRYFLGKTVSLIPQLVKEFELLKLRMKTFWVAA